MTAVSKSSCEKTTKGNDKHAGSGAALARTIPGHFGLRTRFQKPSIPKAYDIYASTGTGYEYELGKKVEIF